MEAEEKRRIAAEEAAEKKRLAAEGECLLRRVRLFVGLLDSRSTDGSARLSRRFRLVLSRWEPISQACPHFLQSPTEAAAKRDAAAKARQVQQKKVEAEKVVSKASR